MERLTTRDGNCFMPKRMVDDDRSYCEEYCHEPCDDYCPLYECFQKLANYEDAEEQGRLIEFPVAIGQHLWKVEAYPPSITETTVMSLHMDGNGNLYAHAQEAGKGNIRTYILSGLGDWLFTDREQAETKLKERESKVEECIKAYNSITKEDIKDINGQTD